MILYGLTNLTEKRTEERKSERKRLNAKRKHFDDKAKEKEGEMVSYAPGLH